MRSNFRLVPLYGASGADFQHNIHLFSDFTADPIRRRNGGVAVTFNRYYIAYSPRGMRDFPIIVGATINLTYMQIALAFTRLPE